MTLNVILPSKIVVDIHPFRVDFAAWLLEGETIASVEVTNSVWTGEDANPANMLYLDPEIEGTVVWQRIKEGISGNVYLVTITATTSLDHQLSATALQAVLPNGVPAEDIYIPLFLTSRPYPLNEIQALDLNVDPVTGFIILAPLDGVDVTVSIQAAVLRDILLRYEDWPAEAIDVVASLQSGTLRTILLQYVDGEPEAIDVTASIQAGLLKNVLIQYTNWPAEAVDHSVAIVAGSLI